MSDLESHTCFCILQTQLDVNLARWEGVREEMEAIAADVSSKLKEIEVRR